MGGTVTAPARTDPTRIPLTALVAPVAGMVATGFVALHAASRDPRSRA